MSRYLKGQWNFTCAICSRTQKSGAGEKAWDGTWVCRSHKEVRNPQDFIRVPKESVPPWRTGLADGSLQGRFGWVVSGLLTVGGRVTPLMPYAVGVANVVTDFSSRLTPANLAALTVAGTYSDQFAVSPAALQLPWSLMAPDVALQEFVTRQGQEMGNFPLIQQATAAAITAAPPVVSVVGTMENWLTLLAAQNAVSVYIAALQVADPAGTVIAGGFQYSPVSVGTLLSGQGTGTELQYVNESFSQRWVFTGGWGVQRHQQVLVAANPVVLTGGILQWGYAENAAMTRPLCAVDVNALVAIIPWDVMAAGLQPVTMYDIYGNLKLAYPDHGRGWTMLPYFDPLVIYRNYFYFIPGDTWQGYTDSCGIRLAPCFQLTRTETRSLSLLPLPALQVSMVGATGYIGPVRPSAPTTRPASQLLGGSSLGNSLLG